MDEPELTPIERLAVAVQDFVNATCPEPNALATSFVVVLEWSRFDQEGAQLFALDYATHGGGMATGLGLARAGQVMIERDTMGDDDG